MPSFIVLRRKKIVGVDFENFDKVYFVTDRPTYIPRAIYRTFPSGVQNLIQIRIILYLNHTWLCGKTLNLRSKVDMILCCPTQEGAACILV